MTRQFWVESCMNIPKAGETSFPEIDAGQRPAPAVLGSQSWRCFNPYYINYSRGREKCVSVRLQQLQLGCVMRSNILELISGRKSNFRRSKQLMLASQEPKINLLPKCVPSVFVLRRIVFRSEEHAIRTYFRFNISVGSFCRFQLSCLHMLLPTQEDSITSMQLISKHATCTLPTRSCCPWQPFSWASSVPATVIYLAAWIPPPSLIALVLFE